MSVLHHGFVELSVSFRSVAILEEWPDKLDRYGPRTLSGRSVQMAAI
jgi:hypothetical protein